MEMIQRQVTGFPKVLLLLALVAALLPLTASGSAASSPLERDDPEGLFASTGAESPTLAYAAGDAVLRSRSMTVELGYLGDPGPDLSKAGVRDTVTLNLFDDVVLVATLDRLEPNATGGGYAWMGQVEGEPYSLVILVVVDGQMTGNVESNQGLYQIRPAGDGLHVVREIDREALLEFEGDAVTPPAKEKGLLEILGSGSAPGGGQVPDTFERTVAGVGQHASQSTSDQEVVVDLLAIYTPNARVKAGSAEAMRQEYDAVLAEANAAYANSGIHLRLNLVHIAEVNYADSDSLLTDLNRLMNTSDGFMDEVHALRDSHLADLVTLAVADPKNNASGIACKPPHWYDPMEGCAFSVNSLEAGLRAFTHEVGHNLGADHDWYVDDDPYDQHFPSAHGHISLGGRWRTIMAYSSLCSQHGFYCPRIPYFSNPEVSYGGRSTGVAVGTNLSCTAGNADNPPCDADSRLTINESAGYVADYRRPPVPATLSARLSWYPYEVHTTTVEVYYTLEIENSGELPATGVRVADTIPAQTTYVEGSANQGGAFAQGQIVWSGLTVAAGQRVELWFTLGLLGGIQEGTALVNTVEVTSNEGASLPATQFVTHVDPERVFLPLVARNARPQPPPGADSDNIIDALPVASGQTVSGQVSQGDRFDVFRIELRAGQPVELSLTGTGGDADLYLFGPSTTDVTRDPALAGSYTDGNYEWLRGRVLADGPYYPVVHSYMGTTDYGLFVYASEP
jgi:uncharacterized repeat protein (TIGR01451 family)